MMIKAALYARYSTELQSADSIEDQFRVCERLAERHAFRVAERFSDAAISGGTAERPGYQALLAAARSNQFGVIIAEDTSRLWRNLAEQWRAVAELLDAGVHIVTQDIDTRAENFKLLLSMHGAMADVYRDQIAYRTRRGLEGRARKGLPCGGRAFGYLAARDSASGLREIHPEQARTVRQIFQWYADGKSPRWIAAELNAQRVPSPGASWRRNSNRLNSKRKRGWVSTAIHGDRRRGTGILNNRAYVGELIWGRSTWKRSAADSKQRRWKLNEGTEIVEHRDERLRIISKELWEVVKKRQADTETTSVRLRNSLKRANGRHPRHLLSGLLVCEECGGLFRRVNAREYGCASHKDGGSAACSNGVRVRSEVAEARLLAELHNEILSPEGIALLERKVREYMRAMAAQPRTAPKPEAARIAKKAAEIEQLRALMKAGTLSQAVAQVAIEKAEEELHALDREQPAREERQLTRIIRMLPRAAEVLRERVRGGNCGLRDPRAITEGRNVLFASFGGRIPVRRATPKPGDKPYLIARVALNRSVVLAAAAGGAAFCLQSGSGGRI